MRELSLLETNSPVTNTSSVRHHSHLGPLLRYEEKKMQGPRHRACSAQSRAQALPEVIAISDRQAMARHPHLAGSPHIRERQPPCKP